MCVFHGDGDAVAVIPLTRRIISLAMHCRSISEVGNRYERVFPYVGEVAYASAVCCRGTCTRRRREIGCHYLSLMLVVEMSKVQVVDVSRQVVPLVTMK